MSELDELRQMVIDQDEPDWEGLENAAVKGADVDDGRIFGLNAVERMFLSIGLFLVVTVFSVLLLLITDSIAIP